MNAASRTTVRSFELRSFRNLEQVAIEPASRFNLVYGNNGHGKTSLIEALYVACTTKSFRTSKLAEAIQQGSEQASMRASVETLGTRRTLTAKVAPRGRSFLLDGKRPRRSLDYARATPVIAFHPGDLSLASGPASFRRGLLDRILVHEDPGGSDARLDYQRAVRERQRILAETGTAARELEAYEVIMARHGARLQAGRKQAAERLGEAAVAAFQRMIAAPLDLEVSFEEGGTEDETRFVEELVQRRRRDLGRGAATFGPHRDELALSLGGRRVRTHASQGQQRLATLALKFAELILVRSATGAEPLLLLDDVSSELDSDRTNAVFSFLSESQSQIFVTTTRPDLFSEVLADSPDRADFEVQNGRIRAV